MGAHEGQKLPPWFAAWEGRETVTWEEYVDLITKAERAYVLDPANNSWDGMSPMEWMDAAHEGGPPACKHEFLPDDEGITCDCWGRELNINRRHRVSPDLALRIVSLGRQGELTAQQIAEALELPRTTVLRYLHEAGVDTLPPNRPPIPVDVVRLGERYLSEDAPSLSQLAEEFGIGINTVKRRLQRAGLYDARAGSMAPGQVELTLGKQDGEAA